MADLSKIRLNGTNYNLKDAEARNAINNFEETDPVFSASAAADITSTDITNWNNKLSSYTETDPTVPAWAKAANKPTYTASEVGALPSTTVIPTITDTYSSTSHNGMSGVAVNSAITTAIGNINSFDVAIVSSTSAVTTPNNHTIYFVPQAVNSSIHDEYMYINNNWELIGTTTIDLSGYLQSSDIAAWAKAANKPSYTASEVGAVPAAQTGSGAGQEFASNIQHENGLIEFYTESGDDSSTLSINPYEINITSQDITISNQDRNDNVYIYNVVSPSYSHMAANKQYVDTKFANITHPVTSVNGQTGAVSLTIPTVPTNISSFTNDSGYLTLATLPIYDGTVQNG